MTSKNENESWVNLLEVQSWHVELIASGLAVYTVFSLGKYIEILLGLLILNLPNRSSILGVMILLYVVWAHIIIVTGFVIHLVLRIVWVSILGLNSVFPEGINIELKQYSKSFMVQLKERYFSLSEFSLKLDKYCSLIFSILCYAVLSLINISFWVLICLIADYYLLQSFTLEFIEPVVLTTIFVLSIFMSLFVTGPFRNSSFAQKYGYIIFMKVSNFFMPFGFETITYIMFTLRSNTNFKSYFGIGMVITFLTLSTFPDFK